jgi:hypothetical protein
MPERGARRRRVEHLRIAAQLAPAGILGVLLSVVLVACGGSGSSTRTATLSAPTRSLAAVTETAPADTAPAGPVTVTTPAETITETLPGETVEQVLPPETVTISETQTATVTETSAIAIVPPPSTTETTSTGVNPAAAAAAGAAAAAAKNEEADTSSTDWGWIAFAILAGALVVGGIVWLVKRRSSKGGTAQPPPVAS